jgi:copper(I)-binding protein
MTGTRRALLSLLLAGVVSAALGATAGLRVSNPWSYSTPPGVSMAVGYLEIANDGPDDRLLGASSPRARRVELHESRLEGGMMRMRPLEGLDVPKGATVRFAPGGMHMMLVDIDRPFVAGERVPLVLEFAHAGKIPAVLVVRGADAD